MVKKLTRPGEGERERRPSKYGEGGRNVGGNARRSQIKFNRPSAPIVTGAKKLGAAPAPAAEPSEFPEPGGHPAHLVERAEAAGKKVPQSAFERLKALSTAAGITGATATDERNSGTNGSPESPDSLFTPTREVPRPTRTRAHALEELKKLRASVPALRRTQKIIDVSEQEDDNEDRSGSGTGTLGDADPGGTGQGSSSMGGLGEGTADGGSSAAGGEHEGILTNELSDLVGDHAGSEEGMGGAGDGSDLPRLSLFADAAHQPAPRTAPDGAAGEGQTHTRGRTNPQSVTHASSMEGAMDPDREANTHARAEDGKQHSEKRHLNVLPSTSMRGEGKDHGTSSPVSPLGGTNSPVSPLAAANSPVSPGGSYGSVSPSVDEDDRSTPYTEMQELVVGRLLGGIPQIACNGCAAQESCPDFKENSTCAYDEDFGGLTSRNLDNLLPRMEVLADLQFKRGMHAAYVERRKSGGQLQPEVTRQLTIAMDAAERVARLKTPQQKSASAPIMVIQQNGASGGGPPKGGLVSALLAGIMGKKNEQTSQGGEITINDVSPRHADMSQPIETSQLEPGSNEEETLAAEVVTSD